MSLQNIMLGEFKRLVETASHLNIVSQQQMDGHFAILVIDSTGEQTKAYSVRHARENKPRTWRIDRLSKMLKEIGVHRFEVRHLDGAKGWR